MYYSVDIKKKDEEKMVLKMYSGSKKNDIYTIDEIGSGNIQAYVRASKGKDKVVLAGNNIDLKNLKISQGKETVFTADGVEKDVLTKDLILTYEKDGKVDTIVLENYFKNKNGNSTASSFKTLVVGDTEYNIADLYKYTVAVPTKGSKVNGSMFSDTINMAGYTKGLTINAGAGNDTITGTSLNDIIKAVSGTNTINGGQGDDRLYAGKGADTFVFSGNNFGRDTIYSSNEMDSVKFSDNNLKYDKVGNNLVITKLDEEGKDTHNAVTVANYFKQKEGKTIQLQGDVVVNTTNGTWMNDNIVGTYKADKISSGKGNDIINAGNGNDTITLNGAGEKSIKLAHGGGNDTIKITANDVVADLVFDMREGYEYQDDESDLCLDYWCYKTGNDLKVFRMYADYDEANPKDVTTIKDYFKSNYDFKLTINGNEIDPESIVVEEHGAKNKANKFVSDANYIENWFYGGNKNDTYTSSTSSDSFVDEKGNDTYNVTDLKSDTWIWDKAGKDTLNITLEEGDQCNLFFNVEKDTNIIVYNQEKQSINGDFYSWLSIYNNATLDAFEGELSGGLSISDYFGDAYLDEDGEQIGGGAIETIKINDKNISTYAASNEYNTLYDWIEMVQGAVQGWLGSNNFDSAAQVQSEGTEEQIAGLLGAYRFGNDLFFKGEEALNNSPAQ